MKDTTEMTETSGEILARIAPELRGGDDREMWQVAVRQVLADVEKLGGLDPSPRHLLVAFARVPGKRAGLHPDEQATLFLAWERNRDDRGWRFAGTHPHVKRHRGSYTAAVCIPQGTTRLAYADVVVLWRPHLPWAPPEDTEMGRQTYRFRRDADATWRFAGVREG
ncbi:MAG: hypothetical protein GZ089_08685 [Aromatoleum sp.]|nr:hypothetical protein [Aromatoleum sp.]